MSPLTHPLGRPLTNTHSHAHQTHPKKRPNNSENKRGRGFGRCVLEAIEEIARALGIGRLLLCSTVEAHVRATWTHLGFVETSDDDLKALDVQDPDLVHMTVRLLDCAGLCLCVAFQWRLEQSGAVWSPCTWWAGACAHA